MMRSFLVAIGLTFLGASSVQGVYIDLRGLPSPATSTSAGGIAVDWSAGRAGGFVSTATSFGFDATSAGDTTELIDGGSGQAEEVGFIFRTPVKLDSIVVSQFGGSDAGTFTLTAFGSTPQPLTSGVNNLQGATASAGTAHYVRWTGPNIAGGGLGFSIDGFNVRPVALFSADFNSDSVVDGADLLVWQRGLGPFSLPAVGNANWDTQVNGLDLQVWRLQFGGAMGVASAVPEPVGGGMLGVAGIVMAGVRVGRRAPLPRRG